MHESEESEEHKVQILEDELQREKIRSSNLTSLVAAQKDQALRTKYDFEKMEEELRIERLKFANLSVLAAAQNSAAGQLENELQAERLRSANLTMLATAQRESLDALKSSILIEIDVDVESALIAASAEAMSRANAASDAKRIADEAAEAAQVS